MEVTETRDTGIDDRDGNRIYATDGSLTVQGSQVNAPGVIRMLGEDEVNLVAGHTRDTISTENSSSAAAMGVTVKVIDGGGTGVTADISASKGNGSASGSSVNYTNTMFNTGTVVADISGSMRVVGAQVNAAGAVGRIGGDLEITSLQNTSTYTSDQQSSGFSVNIPLTTNTAGSASVNASRSNLNNSFASVGQQSGIFTGDGGFDLDVGGTTYLTGGVLTTTDTGVAERRNQIRSQGGIVYRDLENHAISDGSSTSVGLSIGLQKPETGKQTPAEASAANNQGNNNRPAINGIGWGQAGSSNSSITTAGISGLGGDSSVRTGTDSSNALSNDFNAAAMQQNLGAQVRVTQEFGQAVPKAVGTYADNKVSEALRRGDFDEAKRWSEGGIYRVAMHTAVGALGTGTVTGAAVSGGVALAANQLNELQAKMAEGLVSAGLSPAVANSVSGGVIGLGIAAAGNAAGVPAAGYMAANTDMNNRQIHRGEVDFVRSRINKYAAMKGISKAEAAEILLRGAQIAIDAQWNKFYEDNNGLDYAAYQEAAKFLTQEAQQAGASYVGPDNVRRGMFSLIGSNGNVVYAYDNKPESQLPQEYYNQRAFISELGYLSADQLNFLWQNARDGNSSAGNGVNNLRNAVRGFFEGDQAGTDAARAAIAQAGMNPIDTLGRVLRASQGEFNEIREKGVVDYVRDGAQGISLSIATKIGEIILPALQGNYQQASRVVGATVSENGMYAATGGAAVRAGAGVTRRITQGVASPSGQRTGSQTATNTAQACTTVCFIAGTLIQTNEGLKPIESFNTGELVWARHEDTHAYGYRMVTRTKATPLQEIYAITVRSESGRQETYRTTEEHPFWTVEEGWRKAGLLSEAYTLIDRTGAPVQIIHVEKETELQDVYNIEVDEHHTYHVGEIGVWVHNAKCCDVPTTPQSAAALRENLATQAGLPRDIAHNPASVWGKSVDTLRQSFEVGGGNTMAISPRASSSGNAQILRVENPNSNITEIQYSPSNQNSAHKAEYYKITYEDGSKAKVIDTLNYRPNFSRSGLPIYDRNTTYYNPQGEIVIFNPNNNTWVPRK